MLSLCRYLDKWTFPDIFPIRSGSAFPLSPYIRFKTNWRTSEGISSSGPGRSGALAGQGSGWEDLNVLRIFLWRLKPIYLLQTVVSSTYARFQWDMIVEEPQAVLIILDNLFKKSNPQ